MLLCCVWLGLVLMGTGCRALSPPSRCCLDKQYSVSMTDIGAVAFEDANAAYPLDGNLRVGYDFYRDRQGTVSHFKKPDGSFSTSYELKDYANRKVYTSKDNVTCTVATMADFEKMFPTCIPDDAKYEGPITFGYGAHNISMHSWSFSFPLSGDGDSYIILSVTQDHCVPVTESIFGRFNGMPVEETLFFTDYHPGIENVNSLEPPTNCVAATASSERQ